MSHAKNQSQVKFKQNQSKIKTDNQLGSKSKLPKSGGYFSRIHQEQMTEEQKKDRIRSTKKNTTKINQQGQLKMKLHDNNIVIKQSKQLINGSEENHAHKHLLQGSEFDNKKIKKYEIMVEMKQKQFVKESNYFDENLSQQSHYGQLNRPHFDMGTFDSFQTFNVKTYLFDRNLNQRIGQ